jgi:hypothetical protein
MLKPEPFTIDSTGPDKGKVFLLTKMDAFRAEKWAIRAFLALIEGGVQIPPELAAGGMTALVSEEAMSAIFGALLGGLGKLDWTKVEPLLDEMLECIRFMPDSVGNPDFSRPLNKAAGDIEEVPTLLKLRGAVLKLHTAFSQAVKPSSSKASTASMVAPITRMSRRA